MERACNISRLQSRGVREVHMNQKEEGKITNTMYRTLKLTLTTEAEISRATMPIALHSRAIHEIKQNPPSEPKNRSMPCTTSPEFNE